jgi:hypothetical protein
MVEEFTHLVKYDWIGPAAGAEGFKRAILVDYDSDLGGVKAIVPVGCPEFTGFGGLYAHETYDNSF